MRTGVVSSITDHPVRRYFERGLVVTVNTDDPKMFGNSLAEEYRRLRRQLGFSGDEIRGLRRARDRLKPWNAIYSCRSQSATCAETEEPR